MRNQFSPLTNSNSRISEYANRRRLRGTNQVPIFLYLLGFLGLLFFILMIYQTHLILSENQEDGDISKKLVFSSTIKNIGTLERKGLNALRRINLPGSPMMELENFCLFNESNRVPQKK